MNTLQRSIWQPLLNRHHRLDFYPCHIENTSFSKAAELFSASPHRVKATHTAPHAARQFLLQLASGRHALLTSYDDFPHSIEISLELAEDEHGQEIAYLSDLAEILTPLGISVPDKSRVGFPHWRL
jgi:hypothetical protein